MKRFTTALAITLTLALAAPAAAQQQEVPKEYLPPPGMCRIWLDNVKPKQQPAVTDCATAVRNRPRNGRVLFGDDYVKRDQRRQPPVNGFSPPPKDDAKTPDSAKSKDKRKRPFILPPGRP